MPKYYIRFTDINKAPLEVEEGDVNETDLDIALFGRIRLEYGERMDQNLLNLLENFAVGMDANLIPPTPTPMPSYSPTPGVFVSPSPSPSTGAPPSPTPVAATPTPTPSPSVIALTLNNILPTIGINDAINTEAWYILSIGADKSINYSSSESGLSYLGQWLAFGNASDYELSYTIQPYGGTDPGDPGPGIGIWHDMSSDVSFTSLTSDNAIYYTYFLSITVRSKANHAYSQNRIVSVTVSLS